MSKKNIISYILLIIAFSANAQTLERKIFKGKVSANSSNLEGIYVLNLTSKKETATKEGGYFSVMAKEGDSIMFSAIQFKGQMIVVDSTCFSKDLYIIKLENKINQLDEVMIVQYKDLNAFSLGIITAPARIYTPAERKYRTATGFDPKVGLNTSMTIDPLFNMLSGRSAMLKKEIEVEKRERWMEKLQDLYSDEYLTQKLKIPTDYIKGFQYFAVENEWFTKSLTSKNKSMSSFLLGELATKYNKMIANEK